MRRGARALLDAGLFASCRQYQASGAAAAPSAVWQLGRAASEGPDRDAAGAATPRRRRRLSWQPAGVSWLHTQKPTAPDVACTQSLLDSLQAAKLREDLKDLAADKAYMSYPELIDFIKQHNAADSDAEAEERANALMRAGVVLRLNSVVYLRPEEIAEMVYRVVPTDPAEARQRLEATEKELADIDRQYAVIKRAAMRWPRFWLNMGCVGLFAQLAGFIYLTYWELSWDVMEPIAYMLSLTYSWLAYVYYVSKGSTLDYGPFMQYWTSQQLRKKMEESGFSEDRYQSLVRQAERYRRYLAAQAAAEAAGNKIS